VPVEPPTALELQNVSVKYSGSDAFALRAVSLALSPGELLAVIGPNGAGKSTLVRVAAGLMAPCAGTVQLFAKDVSQLTRRQIARRVAVVPQHVEVAFGFRVRDVVLMGRAPHQGAMLVPTAADLVHVEDAMARTGLLEFASRPVESLSGGEQKRVAIARALAQQPDILLLDEATAHLDIRHTVELHAVVRREACARGVACLAIMHDLNEVAQHADRVLLLEGGKVRAHGTIPEVMTYRTLREVFGVDLYVGVNELDGTRYFIPMQQEEAGHESSGGCRRYSQK
jgi:iron complex transport system ATP-binding protein